MPALRGKEPASSPVPAPAQTQGREPGKPDDATTPVYLKGQPAPAQPVPRPAREETLAQGLRETATPDVPPPVVPGEEPTTIEVAEPPGKDKPMEVVMAAEVLRRVKRTRQAVSLVSQVIIRAYDEEALHGEVCRHLVSYGGYLMAWIGLAEEGPQQVVRPVAHDGLEPNFLGALRINWTSDLSNSSPTSRALQEQRPHVARNILKEPRYAVLRKEAQLYGYTATCALPLQFAQYGLGVLTIHAMEPDAFNGEEVSLLRELANDLAAGVINLRERGKRQALESRLAAVVDAADDAIIGTDADGTITDWNEGATRMFGYARPEAIGQPLESLIVPPDQHAEQKRIREAVVRGERPPRFETRRRCKEGKFIHTAVTVSPIMAGDGKVIGITAIEHDVTQARLDETAKRARALEEAEAARLQDLEKVRKTFLSEASHELNTPLTPLRIHVEAMRDAASLTPQQIADHLAVIHRNLLRLSNLVRDMLESSRLDSGRFKLELTEFPVAAAVEDAVQNLMEAAAEQGVVLAAGDVDPVAVRGDRHRVDQVLQNLVGNAISFTPSEGRITVDVTRAPGEAVVCIRDSGVGLTPDQVTKLFQPFSRPHEGVGTAPKGTGLGLFISKGIVEQHGGRIWAESAGPGQGSSFFFTLPLAGTPATAAGGGQAPTEAVQGHVSPQARAGAQPGLGH